MQNQKNEVSFVLSEKAKAIIEKFEKQIENRSENDKNELRIDLLMLLLRRLHPEVLSADAKGLFAEIYCLNNKTTDKNTGFLMHCFSENELNNLSNDFNSIWSYYCSMFSIEGIPTIDDYQELLLCESLMPDGKRRLVVTFSFFTLIKKLKELDIDLEVLKSQIKENQIQFKALETVLAELEIRLNTLSLGLLFDRIVIPRLQTISNSDFNSFVEFIEDFVKDEGSMFFLGSPTEINKLDYQQFHKWAVDNKFLHGVIEMDDLPSYDANRQILVLSKQPTDSIFFAWIDGPMDGEGPSIEEIARVLSEKNPDYYKEVSLEDFKAHNGNYYTFAKRQFVPSIIANEGETVVRLGDLVDLYESEVEEDISCYFLNRPYYFINDYYGNIEAVEMPQARRVPNDKFFLFRWDEFAYEFSCAYQSVDYDGLLIDGDSSTGVGYPYDNYTHDPIICTYPNSIVFKLKEAPVEPIDPYYLAKLLYSSREVYAQLECYKLPFSDCILEKDDFLSILVAIPTMEEQQRILNMDRQKALADSKEEIKKNFESYRHDIRMKKHALAQRLTVMNNWWKTLLMARKDGNGIIDDEAVVGRLHPVAVKNIYTQIGHEMNMLFKQVNSFNMDDTMKVDVFDAKDFIQQYVNHHDPMFEYQCELPEKAANIRFPKEAFRIILDNISSNACSHGFKGREKEKNIIRILAEIKGQDLIIRIDNNGRPMPVGMTAEKVFTYGDTTEEGSDEHGGLGGYLIKDMMTKFGGEVELELNAEADFPVAYKLVFRDVNIYK